MALSGLTRGDAHPARGTERATPRRWWCQVVHVGHDHEQDDEVRDLRADGEGDRVGHCGGDAVGVRGGRPCQLGRDIDAFWVHLPFGHALESVSARSEAGGYSLQGLRILVVDDNETNRLVLDAQLGAWASPPTWPATPRRRSPASGQRRPRPGPMTWL